MKPGIENIILHLPSHKMQLVCALREIILSAAGGIEDIVKWTRITFVSDGLDIVFICSCPGEEYIELGFFKGAFLTDTGCLLYNKNKSKEIRRIKISNLEKIPVDQIKDWVRETIGLKAAIV